MQSLNLIMILSLIWLIISTIMQHMRGPRKKKAAKKMADVLKFLDLLQRNTGPSRNKHDSNESCIRKPQWGGWTIPLISEEIVEAQKADTTLKHFFKRNAVLDKGPELQLVENESCICNKGRLAIKKPLQRRATIWYHHYLQHPGHTRLEETMKSAIYWKWMRNTIRFITKSCKSCQMNKNVHESIEIFHLKS